MRQPLNNNSQNNTTTPRNIEDTNHLNNMLEIYIINIMKNKSILIV
jgi:hypothetical protein